MGVNWVQKTLEDANLKLAAVATDVLGVSGRERRSGGEWPGLADAQ